MNTIKDKVTKVKLQEQMTENIGWEEVRNIIIIIDNASHLSDVYKKNNLVVPLLQQKLADLVVKRDICQQHAWYLKRNYIASSAIQRTCTTPLHASKSKNRIMIRKRDLTWEKQTKKLNRAHPVKGEKLLKDRREISQT